MSASSIACGASITAVHAARRPASSAARKAASVVPTRGTFTPSSKRSNLRLSASAAAAPEATGTDKSEEDSNSSTAASQPGEKLEQYSVVMKFGGSSVADAERMREVATIVLTFQEEMPIVVLSAMGKTTNNLLAAGEQALKCDDASEAGVGVVVGSKMQLSLFSHRVLSLCSPYAVHKNSADSRYVAVVQ